MDKLLSIPEAAAMLGVTVRTIRHWIASGTINAEKTGSRWGIPADEIERIRSERK